MSLVEELQRPKSSLSEFYEISKRAIVHLSDVVSSKEDKGDFTIFKSNIAGTTKFVRPINNKLFIADPTEFASKYEPFFDIIQRIRERNLSFSDDEKIIIDRFIYTIQQSIGAGLDVLAEPNSARKHVGNRFEELIKSIFTEIGVANKRIVLRIPYPTEQGDKIYKCENDLILSGYKKVKSSSTHLDTNEIVVSVKTTSKDRMGKIFIDKMLLERFVKHDQKVIGVFLNDVQRKKDNSISYTLVSGLFMVYTNFLVPLNGIYYLDPPPNALVKPYSSHMKKFSELITNDIFKMLSS